MNKILWALLLPFLSCAPCLAAEKTPETVWDIIASRKELSGFAKLVADAGVKKAFSSKDGNITVFAPTNAALGKLPADAIKRAKNRKDGLEKLVMHHTIKNSRVSYGNMRNRRAGLGSGAGESLGIEGDGKNVKINSAKIIVVDLTAKGGVVHILDAPLVPESLASDKGAAPSEMGEPESAVPEAPASSAPPPSKKKGIWDKTKKLFGF